MPAKNSRARGSAWRFATRSFKRTAAESGLRAPWEQGATFFVRLRSGSSSESTISTLSAPPAGCVRNRDFSGFQPMNPTHAEFHILLIEDSRADAKIIERALQESEIAHRLTVIPDGRLALDYLFDLATRKPPTTTNPT